MRLMSAKGIRDRFPHPYWRIKALGQRTAAHLRLATEDIVIFDEIFIQGEYAEAAASLQVNSCVFDLGGNIGLASMFIEQSRLPRLVVAVEPDATNYALLKLNNADAIRDGRLFPHQAFIAAHAGNAAIFRANTQPAGYRMASSDESTELGAAADIVACTTMVDLVAHHNVEVIDLLKCDIEGAEEALFSDCKAWIHRVRSLVVETHHPYSPERLIEDLRTAGANVNVQNIKRRGNFAVVTASLAPSN